MEIPVTTRLTERPVWARHLRRVWGNTGPMLPPTEEEQADAILVLSDPLNELLFGLWDEANRIFDEASVKSYREDAANARQAWLARRD